MSSTTTRNANNKDGKDPLGDGNKAKSVGTTNNRALKDVDGGKKRSIDGDDASPRSFLHSSKQDPDADESVVGRHFPNTASRRNSAAPDDDQKRHDDADARRAALLMDRSLGILEDEKRHEDFVGSDDQLKQATRDSHVAILKDGSRLPVSRSGYQKVRAALL